MYIHTYIYYNSVHFIFNNSSEYHTFYLKTTSNIGSLTQLQLSVSCHTFHLPKNYLNYNEKSTDCTE